MLLEIVQTGTVLAALTTINSGSDYLLKAGAMFCALGVFGWYMHRSAEPSNGVWKAYHGLGLFSTGLLAVGGLVMMLGGAVTVLFY